jgi:predicted acylesterase/phospholipase RssA
MTGSVQAAPSPGDVPRDLALTFAGGGNRAFYQLGLMNVWAPSLLPRLAGIASCSAGACVVMMWLTGRRAQAREIFQSRTRGLRRNIDPSNLLRGEPMAPHGRVYRDILLAMARDGGLEHLRAQPWPLLVSVSAFPRWIPAALATVVGISAYQLEKAMRPRLLHPTFGRALAFAPHVFDMRGCETPEELAALVLASSATPPFTPVGEFRGRKYLDGGMVDNAPAFVGDGLPGVRRNVVLLTRPYPGGLTGVRGARLYVAPSGPVPAGRWDYTRPQGVEEAVEMGEREAHLHVAELARFLDGEIGAPGTSEVSGRRSTVERPARR